MKTHKTFFLVLFLFTILLPMSTALWPQQSSKKLRATSADIKNNKTYIVIYWEKGDPFTGYNLYRKDKHAGAYPKIPLNGKAPIAMVSSCTQLKSIIPKDSNEWQMMKNAFASLSGQSQTGIKKKKAPSSIPGTGSSKMVAKPTESPLRSAALISAIRPDFVLRVDPCNALDRGLTPKELGLFDMLAAVNLKFRLARGLAFIDYTVQPNQWYTYQVKGITREGTEKVIGTPVEIQAGKVSPPLPPKGFTLYPGDSKILALWNRNPDAFSYMIRRSTSAGGPFQLVNDKPVFFDIEKDLAGKKIKPPRPGFVDFRRWKADGLPTSHKVNGKIISGPKNNVTYFYQVASRDILDRQGKWGGTKSAAPKDKTPPRAPGDFKVDPSKSPVGIALSWRKVTRDIEGHQEQDSQQTYKIFRADTLEKLQKFNKDGSLPPAYLVKTLTAKPKDKKNMTIQWTDTDPAIFPQYGEKDYWYRIQCIDMNKSISGPSAALSARVPDTTPPGPTTVTGSQGHADHITVFWRPNNEPDAAGYQVWRSICDKGKPFQPTPDGDTYLPCDFVLLKEILTEDANAMLEKTGSIYYHDYSLAKTSSPCYAYWVRAFDRSRNLYMGNNGCPAGKNEYACQKLYEESAPPPPIISGLKARNNTVSIQWISSPIQDLRAFHIYRSQSPTSPPVFRACVFTDGTVKTTKWQGTKPSCQDIPAKPNPKSVKGSYLDKNVEPHQVFWYRVSALDWLGNESMSADITKIPAISTFTYSKDLPQTPTITSVKLSTTAGCGLIVHWNPVYNASKFKGFLVYRSAAAAGPFRQVSPLVKGNKFDDKSAIPGKTYRYRVQSMDTSGKLSEPSSAVNYKYSKK